MIVRHNLNWSFDYPQGEIASCQSALLPVKNMPSRAARSSLRAEGRIVEKLTTIEDELPKVQRQIHKVRIEKNATR